ncbi:CpsD/CapB family tyrosine-protein kinase [Gemmiger sp.]
MSAPKKKEHRKLFTVGGDAPFQFTEAYKSLRTNLEFLSASGNCKTILITSSVPEEGKTNVAINLALTMAASGKRVVLVDCDMRKSVVSRYMRIPRNRPGLTNVITSRDDNALAGALVRMKDNGITILPVGTIPPNPAELLASPATEKIFAALQSAFDYVIVDTPPVSVVTDAAVLCRVADGVLLVVRPGVTTIQGAQLSKKNLEAVNAHILGVIMNGYDAKKTGRKDGYSYAYSYGYYDTKQDSAE